MPLSCVSDGTQNTKFGIARLGRLGDQVADQNGGVAPVLISFPVT
jgi:hypothetical protein